MPNVMKNFLLNKSLKEIINATKGFLFLKNIAGRYNIVKKFGINRGSNIKMRRR